MKNVTLALIGVSLSALMLADCQQSEPIHTVDWYQGHAKELTAKLHECRQNPGELKSTPNCKNAERAAWLKDSHAKSFQLH